MTRCILYARLSHTTDNSASIRVQLDEMRAYVARQPGWVIADELIDDGVSGRVARAKADEAVRRLRAGADPLDPDGVDALIAWRLDRFSRGGWRGVDGLVEALEYREGVGNPGTFATVRDNLHSGTPQFALLIGLLSQLGKQEADSVALRQRAAIHYRRTHGLLAANGMIPFGFRSKAVEGGRVLVPSAFEAPIVRATAERILSREPLARIARDLHNDGIATTRSLYRRALLAGDDPADLDRGTWHPSTLRAIYGPKGSHTLLGYQKHRGELVRGTDGLPEAVWPALLDASTVHDLRLALTSTPGAPRRTRQSRMLSGLAFCARCQGKLVVTSSGARPVYACAKPWKPEGQCGGVTIDAQALDDYVASQFLIMAGHLWETTTDAPASTPADAELAEIENALREATDALLTDEIDPSAVITRIGDLKARRTALRASQRHSVPTPRPTGRTLAQVWADHDSPDWRRSVLLSAGLDHLTIGPGKPWTPRVSTSSGCPEITPGLRKEAPTCPSCMSRLVRV